MTVPPAAERNARELLDRACEAHETDRLPEAEKFYRAALDARPDYAEALLGLGMLLRRSGRRDQAMQYLERCSAVASRPADAWLELGLAHAEARDYESASGAFAAAAMADPALAGAHMNLGLALAGLGRVGPAMQALERAAALAPDRAEIWKHYALVALEADRPGEALHASERAAAAGLDPALASGLRGLAGLCAGRYDIAERETRRALVASPDAPDLTMALCLALEGAGRAKEAIEQVRASLARVPGERHMRFLLAMLLLAEGAFREAWPHHAARPSAREHPASAACVADAGKLKGAAVLIHSEQGIGDEILFLRYVPLLRALAGPETIFYSPSSRIRSLAGRIAELDGVYLESEGGPWAGPQILLGDLPLLCDGVSPQGALPPPLRVRPLDETVAVWRATLAAAGPPPYLAVSWVGGEARKRAGQLLAIGRFQLRRIEPKRLGEALKGWPGTAISVQYRQAADDFDAFRDAFGGTVLDASAANEDVEILLALLSWVDELVCVSSASVHLRAAAGRQARVLVQHPPDWRWMLEGERSPWYPGTPLYRQRSDLDWSEALARLRADLDL